MAGCRCPAKWLTGTRVSGWRGAELWALWAAQASAFVLGGGWTPVVSALPSCVFPTELRAHAAKDACRNVLRLWLHIPQNQKQPKCSPATEGKNEQWHIRVMSNYSHGKAWTDAGFRQRVTLQRDVAWEKPVSQTYIVYGSGSKVRAAQKQEKPIYGLDVQSSYLWKVGRSTSGAFGGPVMFLFLILPVIHVYRYTDTICALFCLYITFP